MPATCEERANGRKRGIDNASVEYIIRDTEETDEAILALQTEAPADWDDLALAGLTVEEVSTAQKIWYGTATYGRPAGSSDGGNNIPVGSVEYSFDVSTTNVRITHSLQTIAKYPSGSAPDYKQGILPRDDGTFEGIDVLVPVATFQYVFKPAAGVITDLYQRQVEAIVGSTNSATWRNREAGEVMLVGASGSRDSAGNQSLSFKFQRRVNVTGQVIGAITGIDKKGHEFLWVLPKKQEDTTRVISVPQAVYVERVYPSANFATVLGF